MQQNALHVVEFRQGTPLEPSVLWSGFTADIHVTSGPADTPGIITKMLTRPQAAVQLATTPLKIPEKYQLATSWALVPRRTAEDHHPAAVDLENPSTMGYARVHMS